jgi:gluconokinase
MTALDLGHAPPVLFLFGLAGAGKTHVGQLVSQLSGRFFYDADADISEAMKQALAEQRPFTEAMRDDFFPRVVERIRQLQKTHGALVVTQGVYKQRHRDYLEQALPQMQLLCVQCTAPLLQQRLAHRTHGISPDSAAALLADFETPAPHLPIIHNDTDAAAVIAQLQALYPAAG